MCRVTEALVRIVGLKKQRAFLKKLERIVAGALLLFRGPQHGHTEDNIEPAEPAQDAVAGIDETNPVASLQAFSRHSRLISAPTISAFGK